MLPILLSPRQLMLPLAARGAPCAICTAPRCYACCAALYGTRTMPRVHSSCLPITPSRLPFTAAIAITYAARLIRVPYPRARCRYSAATCAAARYEDVCCAAARRARMREGMPSPLFYADTATTFTRCRYNIAAAFDMRYIFAALLPAVFMLRCHCRRC